MERAVARDLRALKLRDAGLATGAIAAGLLELGRRLDDPNVSATAKSMCQREIREGLARLWELAPPEMTKDRLDDVSRAREQRRRRAGA